MLVSSSLAIGLPLVAVGNARSSGVKFVTPNVLIQRLPKAVRWNEGLDEAAARSHSP
jgi:hypothetical protein